MFLTFWIIALPEMVNIKCHKLGRSYERPHFFILSKGMNSGKPLERDCPNCFVFIAADKAERDFYFWLSFGLWKSKAFHQFLTGSVIQFLRIADLEKVLQKGAIQASSQKEAFQNAVSLLIRVDQYEMNLKKTISMLSMAKVQIFKVFLTN